MLGDTACRCTHAVSSHYPDGDKIACNECECGSFMLATNPITYSENGASWTTWQLKDGSIITAEAEWADYEPQDLA